MRQEILLQPTYRRTMRYGELSKGPLPPCEAQTIPVPHAAEGWRKLAPSDLTEKRARKRKIILFFG